MKPPPSRTGTRVWRRLVPARLADVWRERLLWAGPDKTVWTEFPGGKSLRVEIFDLRAAEAERLRAAYGGEVRNLKPRDWLQAQDRQFCLPLPPHLCLFSPEARVPPRFRRLPALRIPAGMAFGTGEHPTTRLCLRHALREAGTPPRHVADLGTGSGIIALALSLAGHRVEAIDFDPEAIREARANAAANPHIPPVDWKVGRVEDWKPGKKFDLIVANLFAEILTASMTSIIRPLKPGGTLVLSGILRDKAPAVLDALHAHRLTLRRHLRVGKWAALIVDRPKA